MRTVALVVLLAFACLAGISCGADCGDGTVERDGTCVAADAAGGAGGTDSAGGSGGSAEPPAACRFWVSDVERKCHAVCLDQDYDCDRRCAARAEAAGDCACQACLIESYGYFPDSESMARAQELCVPYCSGRVLPGEEFWSSDVERKCHSVCFDEAFACDRRCSARADRAGPTGCRACQIESYANFPDGPGIFAAQEACLSYCID